MPGERGVQGLPGLRGPAGPRSGGVVYTRWGSSSCPSVTGTQLVYSGRAAGTYYATKGVELIISACHPIHSTPCAIKVECRVAVHCMEWNMNILW